ncbi:MAG TPA: xanthine dehydrogenase family protein molybdopterin-binding subunit [Stellaceae bacterium]|nr:xanthine dehydrogenase family protein molybdopterin-binding subunit [Stellaceae bacterium]
MTSTINMPHDRHPRSSDWVGRQFSRKEDHRLTTGKGQYFADILVPGMLHLVFVRSTHAHARIKRIDFSAARALPGVVAVVTGADIKDQIKSLPQPVVVPALPARYPTFWPLAVDKVKFHGEPVAAVIARDKYVAEDAAELVEVEYEPLPHVRNMETALDPAAPLVHEGWPDNEMFALTFTGGGTAETQAANDAEVDGLIRAADVVVKQRYRVHRCGVTPLETRGALATWDDGDGMTAWITTQRPHIDRLAMSDVLDIPAEKLRVIAPRDQGGGFGVKAPFYREPILVCYMARKLKRPVRWLETREEHLMSVSQERDQMHDLEVAATNDGRIVALRDRGLADNGDGCEGVYWGYLMPFLGAALLPNAYDLPKCDIKIRVACTNKAVLSPARSFGAFPARFALERSIDKIARRVGKDPAEVRRINFIRSLPHVTATGVNYDSGDFLKVWDLLIKTIDLPKFRAEQREARRQGRYVGVGFGVGAELSGVASSVLVPMENQPGYGAATVRLDPRGKVLVFEGDAPGGQGHETTMSQVVAQEFGIHPNDVIVAHGDTGTTPFGSGTIGARSGSYTVSAISIACRFLKKKIARIMAHDLKLDADPSDFVFADGQIVFAKDDNIRKTFREMVERIIMAPLNLPQGESGGLEHTAFFEADAPMICFSAHACFVEVDAKTGQFKITRYVTSEDVGTVINPQIVEAQVQGGVVQGISNALFEQFVYDEAGQQLTSTFENYKLATAADVPSVEVHHEAGTPCPHTPLGSRGLGEGIPGAVPGAVTNAVCDALQPFGIEIDELPLRPDRIWRALKAATEKTAAE